MGTEDGERIRGDGKRRRSFITTRQRKITGEVKKRIPPLRRK
jgi:hypothetical protein